MNKFVAAALMSAATSVMAPACLQAASLDIENGQTVRPLTATTVTAIVTNRSRKDVTNGTVVFDNASSSCTVTFGSIRAFGGQASASCTLSDAALMARAVFNAADGSQWIGYSGNGQAFVNMDIGLNDSR